MDLQRIKARIDGFAVTMPGAGLAARRGGHPLPGPLDHPGSTKAAA